MDLIRQIWIESGIYQITGGQVAMILVCLLLLYLGIVKKFEPLLLVTIGFGGLLSNIPGAGIAEPGGVQSQQCQHLTIRYFPLSHQWWVETWKVH